MLGNSHIEIAIGILLFKSSQTDQCGLVRCHSDYFFIFARQIENGFPEENALFFKKLSDAERFFPDLFSPNDAVLFLNDLPDELN